MVVVYRNTMESRASISQAEELVNKTVDVKVQTVHHTGLAFVPSQDAPAGRNSL